MVRHLSTALCFVQILMRHLSARLQILAIANKVWHLSNFIATRAWHSHTRPLCKDGAAFVYNITNSSAKGGVAFVHGGTDYRLQCKVINFMYKVTTHDYKVAYVVHSSMQSVAFAHRTTIICEGGVAFVHNTRYSCKANFVQSQYGICPWG
jgi:hypothetical protein